MFEYILSFFGLIIGGFLAYLCKEELVKGEKYFVWIRRILLLVMIIAFSYVDFNLWLIIIGLFVGLFACYEYLYLGFISGILNLILVFIYGLVKGTLVYFKESKHWYWIDALMFFIPLISVLIFGLNLSSFAAGGCLGVLIRSFR